MRGLTREEVRTLPLDVLTDPHRAPGSITILAMDYSRRTRAGRWNCALYASFCRYKRAYRAAVESGKSVEADFAARMVVRVWSRLVARARGYWVSVPVTPARRESLRAHWSPNPVGLVTFRDA